MSAPLKLPKVQLTEFLRQSLLDEGLDPDGFATYFAEWKALGADGEYLDYYFGKDGYYDQPKRTGRRVLRHVHMPPNDTVATDAEGLPGALAKWERNWNRRQRKTSDTSLIYAEDPGHGYLFIYIAREPQGHELAQMATPATKNVHESTGRCRGKVHPSRGDLYLSSVCSSWSIHVTSLTTEEKIAR